MNLQFLNLDLYGIPEDATTQVAVYLITAELQARKLHNAFTSIGCDTCFCVPELCEVVLALAGFDKRPDDLYEFYLNLLDEYCEKVTHENGFPVQEAFTVYKKLLSERDRFTN